ARDGIATFATVKEFLAAVAKFQASGAKLNSTYVYDQVSGLKLFGASAFYVMAADGSFATFLRRADAEKHAASVNGKMLTFSEALASLARRGRPTQNQPALIRAAARRGKGTCNEFVC